MIIPDYEDQVIIKKLHESFNMDSTYNPYTILKEIRAEAKAEALEDAAHRAVILAINNDWIKTSSMAQLLRDAITQEEPCQ
jgi:hypothetical protein